MEDHEMRSLFLAFAVLATACAHGGAEVDRLGEPVSGPARLDWTRAAYDADGGRIGAGAVTVPLVVRGHGEGPVELRGWNVRVRTPDGRACTSQVERTLTVPAGRKAEVTVHADCVASG